MGQRIIMHFGNTDVYGELNDTETAKAFAEHLPTTVHVNGTGIDFCGQMPFELPYDEEQVHHGWTNGDINYNPGGGWFAVLFDDEKIPCAMAIRSLWVALMDHLKYSIG